MVKRLPAVRETQVRLLVWEDPLEKGMQPTPVLLITFNMIERNVLTCMKYKII